MSGFCPGPEVGAVVFYDGECGFCSKSVQFIYRRDRNRCFYFAPLQGKTAEHLLPQELRAPDSTGTMVLWVREDGVTAGGDGAAELNLRSEAALRIGVKLAFPWSLFAKLGYLVPVSIREAVYRWVARNRHRLARSGPSCKLPGAGAAARMLP